MGQSVIRCTMYNTELWMLHLLFLGNRNSATPDMKTTKKPPFRLWPKKYVETYSSSNAAAPRGKGATDQYTINTLQDKLSHTKITKEKKIEQTGRLTDLE